jgi:hypothetical protein
LEYPEPVVVPDGSKMLTNTLLDMMDGACCFNLQHDGL